MKKLFLLNLLVLPLVLMGCGSSDDVSKDDSKATVSGEFASAACNKYFDLMECSLNQVPADSQAEARAGIDANKESFKALTEEQQDLACTSAMEAITPQAEAYADFGCPID